MNRAQFVRRGVHEGHAADVGVAAHRVARIDFNRPAAADDDHAAVLRQHAQILSQIDVRGHLQDQIDALVGGQLHQLLEIIRASVIKHVMSALLEDELAALIGAGGADDDHAQGAGELHRRRPHAAAGAVNQN